MCFSCRCDDYSDPLDICDPTCLQGTMPDLDLFVDSNNIVNFAVAAGGSTQLVVSKLCGIKTTADRLCIKIVVIN